MATIPKTDAYAWQASACVLTDPMLWRCITSFQRGIPVPLYDFWVAHDPQNARPRHPNDFTWIRHGMHELARLVVNHGTVNLLKILARFCQEHEGEWEEDYLLSVSHDAIEANRPDMLEWALNNLSHHWELGDLWWAAIQKRSAGDNRVLDLLRIHKPITASMLGNYTGQVVDVDLLRWLDHYFPGGAIGTLTLEHAVRKYKLDVVQYILEHYPTMEFDKWLFKVASQNNDLKILRCLFEKRPTRVGRDFVKEMIMNGRYGEREILRDVGGFEDVATQVAESYIADGQFKKLQDLFAKGLLPSGNPFLIDQAAASGHFDIIQLLQERNVARATTKAMDSAAEAGKWDIVKYLHERVSEGCTTRVMDAAAEQGRLNEIKFYHANRSEGCTKNAMNSAAEAGAIDIVKFLHMNRSEGCTTRAMDAAAANGYLGVVKFLHEHRTEGCTAKAMEKAAMNGHLDVVRFLHFERDEQFWIGTVKKAMRNSEMGVVHFIYEHNPSLFGPDLLHSLLLRGAFSVWMDLRATYPDEANSVVESVMFKAGIAKELATIHFIVKELGREDLAHLAVDGAAMENYPDGGAQWVRAVLAITGPRSCRLSAVRTAARVMTDYSLSEALQYLVTVCAEDGAGGAAIASARESGKRLLPEKLEEWMQNGGPLDLPPMHPLLLNPTCPTWAVKRVFDDLRNPQDPHSHCELPVPWAIHAVYNDDRAFLENLRSLQSSDPLFTFEGARAAAIRKGNRPLLQWLLSDVDVPVESTLLDEALYYHQFEIAEWLVANYVQGCRELNWTSKVAEPWLSLYGLDDGVLLDWIEDNATVRSLVDFGAIAHHAVCCGDVSSLRVLHKTHPELYEMREDLALTAKERGHDDVLSFLEEIRYPFMNGHRSGNRCL